jgi:hypothetical protein
MDSSARHLQPNRRLFGSGCAALGLLVSFS